MPLTTRCTPVGADIVAGWAGCAATFGVRMNQSILLEWEEYTRHSAVLNVPHTFDVSAHNDELYRVAVPEISDHYTTYDSGEYLSFTAKQTRFRPTAESMFFESGAQATAVTAPVSVESTKPLIIMLPNSSLGIAMARTTSIVFSVMPEGPTGVGIEVVVDSADGIIEFMTVLAEVSGYSFADLTRDGYLENDDVESDCVGCADGPEPQFYYFPQVLLVDDSDTSNR